MSKLLEQINNKSKIGSIKDLVFPISNTYNFTGKDKVVFINTGDVFEGKFLHNNYSPIKKLPGQAKKIIEHGDILFSEIRPKNRHFALVDFDSKDYVVSTKLIVLRVKEGIDQKYAYIVLTADKNLREFQNIAESRSGTFPQITFESISDYEVNVPDLTTQKKIAEILSAYDTKIENNNLIIKNLEQTAQTIFNEWFVNFRFPGNEKIKLVDSEMGEIPEGWEVKSVLDVVERIPSGKKYDNKSASPKGNVPILDQGASGFIGYHDEEPGIVASIDNPVVVFTNHTCYYRILTEPFSCIQNVLPYIGKNGYDTFFVYFLTKEKIKMSGYKGHWPEFEQQVFVIPTPEIATQFSKIAKVFIEKIVSCEKENTSLKSQRDQLLVKLI